MITANYISVADFTAYAPEVDTSSYTSATISGMISQASSWVDGYLGYTLAVESVSSEKMIGLIDSESNLVVYTKKVPIWSVSEIKIVKGTTSATLSLTSGSENRYDIPNESNYIVVAGGDISLSSDTVWMNFYSLRNNTFYTVTSYVAGYMTIPEDVKRATTLILKDMVAGQQNTVGARSISQGGISISYDNSGESIFIQQAKNILTDYKRPTLF